jgi:hypothetical protein
VGAVTIKKSLLFLFLALALALVVSNVMLTRRLSHLQRLNDLLNTASKLQPGTSVPPLVGFDGKGSKVTYSYGEDPRDTLLFVLSPGCHACEENWPNWTRVIKKLNGQTTRLLLANVTSNLPVTSDYVAKHEIAGVPILAEVAAESLQAYRMAYTPQTILIGRDGIVREVYTGQLREDVLATDCRAGATNHCSDVSNVATSSSP